MYVCLFVVCLFVCLCNCAYIAAVACEAGKVLVIEEVEVVLPQATEVHLKILYASLNSPCLAD